MSNSEKEDFIAHKLLRAKETFEEAELLINNRRWNAAVNRLYYACFYAVGALLISKDIKARKHSGVIQMFGLHFVSTGIISRNSGKVYSDIFDRRQRGDYEDFFEFMEEDVVVLIMPARQLIDEIKKVLSQQ